VSWKLSRTVLRGGTNCNVGPLLDQRKGKTKQPFCFEVSDGELFAFAGLWDRWRDPSGHWLKSCSILTTTPNAVTSAVHDRMPVILDPDNYDLWLDPGMTNVGKKRSILQIAQ
jgi:putative SOS response-associated peptidase YedK